MARFGFIRPNNDSQAHTLYDWASAVRTMVGKVPRHSIVFDLRPRQIWSALTRAEVVANLPNCEVAVYFGHGEQSMWRGKQPLLDMADASLTTNLIVIAMACHTSVSLGAACDAAGARAYVGFSDKLMWSDSSPSEFGNVIATALGPFIRDNRSIGEAYQLLLSGFGELRDLYKIGSHQTDTDAGVVWLAADWDAGHMKGYGDHTASV